MPNIHGMLFPLPTVFRGDGTPDLDVIRDMTSYYIDSGVHAFFVTGSFGQGPAMTPDERRSVAKAVIEETRGRIPVIVHVGTADPYTTIELGRRALEDGADGTAVVGPYYYSDHKPQEVREYFKMLGRELQAPMLIYDNAGYSGYRIGPDQVRQFVADSPQIFGSKVSDANLDGALQYRDIVGRDFAIFVGASSLVPGLMVGIAGTVSPPLALCPELGVEVVRAVDRGDYPEAWRLQLEVVEFHAAITGFWRRYGYGLFGAGLREIGFAVQQYPRWPVPAVDDESIARLRALIAHARETLLVKQPQHV